MLKLVTIAPPDALGAEVMILLSPLPQSPISPPGRTEPDPLPARSASVLPGSPEEPLGRSPRLSRGTSGYPHAHGLFLWQRDVYLSLTHLEPLMETIYAMSG